MAYLAIILAASARLIDHVPNFAPITALAIFSGAYLSKKQAVGITLLARFVSDLFLGFFSWPLMLTVYLAHIAGILFGLWIRKSHDGAGRWIRIVSSSLAASVIFYLATNFAFLYSQYPHNLSGIILSYANGLPFLRGTLMGDLFYSVGIFGTYEILVASKEALKKKIAIQGH